MPLNVYVCANNWTIPNTEEQRFVLRTKYRGCRKEGVQGDSGPLSHVWHFQSNVFSINAYCRFTCLHCFCSFVIKVLWKNILFGFFGNSLLRCCRERGCEGTITWSLAYSRTVTVPTRDNYIQRSSKRILMYYRDTNVFDSICVFLSLWHSTFPGTQHCFISLSQHVMYNVLHKTFGSEILWVGQTSSGLVKNRGGVSVSILFKKPYGMTIVVTVLLIHYWYIIDL